MTDSNQRNQGAMLFLYAETPLHAGAGAGMGAIDLPLQRERMSGLPIIQGSGLKGAWREACQEGLGEELAGKLFGPKPPGDENEEQKESESWTGAAAFRDAGLLLLPLRTVFGGWAWATCPMVIQRLARDMSLFGIDIPRWAGLSPENEDAAIVCKESAVAKNKVLYIEDVVYKADTDQLADSLAAYLQGALPEHESYKWFKDRIPFQLAVLSDAEFRYLAQTAMEVNIRIRMDQKTGTVAKGALWSEECFPAESLLWTVVTMTDARTKRDGPISKAPDLLDAFCEFVEGKKRIRLGGDLTVGRGVAGVKTAKGGKG